MVAELIAANQPCVALTGAGISTESGVPDFRSASGVWAEYDPYEVASIDGLHQSAGSRDVIEVHGSIATASCVSCGRAEPREQVVELLPLPTCADCGSVLKPDVVMFGELLPAVAVERATALAREAACMLVVGSSLEVWPVAGLPAETLGHGGRLAIVNREPTPYDAQADVVVHAGAGEVLAAAAAVLSS